MNKRQKTSYLWGYFSITDQNNKICKCDLCGQTLCYKSTVSNLKKHMDRRHPTINLKAHLKSDDIPPERVSSQTETPTTSTTTHSELSIIPSTSTSCRTSKDNQSPYTQHSQQRVTSFFASKKTKISDQQKKKLDKLLLRLFTIDYQPFSIVEDEGFKDFVTELNPSYFLPNRKIISQNMISAQYEQCMTVVRNQLASVTSVCITTDCWTSRSVESYIAVTCHFINDDFELKSILLDCAQINVSHTSRNLAEEIKNITEKYNLTKKIVAVISDNAANIKNAVMNELQLKHFGCFAHTLNLIVQDAIKVVSLLVEKVKSIVAYFKRSTLGMDKILAFQKNAGSTNPKKLLQSVPTRWNSTYLMLERICELQDAVKTSVALINKNIPVLSEEEWIVCKELCLVLKPFQDVTVRISGEKYVTASEVIILTNGLNSVCEKLHKRVYDKSTTDVLKELQRGLTTRLKNIEFSKTIALATLLDPRYKLLTFSEPAAAESIKKYAVELMTYIINIDIASNNNNINITDPGPSESQEEEVKTLQGEDLSIWEDFDKIIAAKKPTGI